MQWTIYLLRDPRDGAVRYVGMTSKPLDRRLREHVYEARRGLRCHRGAWLRAVLAAGRFPTIHRVERGVGDGWAAREAAWIARLRSIGCNLTNSTDGGDGLINPSAETRERIGAAQRGRRVPPERVARSNATQRALWSPDRRKAQADEVTQRLADPVARQHVGDGVRKAWAAPGARDRRRSTTPRGEKHGRAKLTLAQVEALRQEDAAAPRAPSGRRRWGLMSAMAKRHGVSWSTIRDVLIGTNWQLSS